MAVTITVAREAARTLRMESSNVNVVKERCSILMESHAKVCYSHPVQ